MSARMSHRRSSIEIWLCAVILRWKCTSTSECDEERVIFPSRRKRKRFSETRLKGLENLLGVSSSILYLAPDCRFERHGIQVWSSAAFPFVHLSIDRSRQWDWQRCVNYLIRPFYLRIENGWELSLSDRIQRRSSHGIQRDLWDHILIRLLNWIRSIRLIKSSSIVIQLQCTSSEFVAVRSHWSIPIWHSNQREERGEREWTGTLY